MSSPLLPYANSYLLIKNEASVSLVDGRWVTGGGVGEENTSYLVRCFLKRSQNEGASTGSKLIPLPSELGGEMMPGAGGQGFLYRGYALEWILATEDVDPSTVQWQQATEQYDWMLPGIECQLRLGDDPLMMNARIQRSSGVFGGQGIDSVVYKEVGGVPLIVFGSQFEV